MINEIANLPEVSFIDNLTLDDVQAMLVDAYQKKHKEVTGVNLTLRRADAETLKLYAVSVVLYQMFMHVDNAGKMDLLKYSYSGFLDNLGALRGVSRLPASSAVCTVRFTLSSVQPSVVTIPSGTMVTGGDNLYFAVDETVEIPVGDMYVDASCTCTTAGSAGNGLIAGTVATLVNAIPYVDSVANTDVTSGGADVESDEDFADRIYIAPSGYSVAGPEYAYKFHTQSYSSSIGDVEVTSPRACEVEVRFLLTDGSIPTQTLLDGVEAHLSADDIRPLTDQLSVLAPTIQTFDIVFSYFINSSDADKAATIQAAVASAVEEYIKWQTYTIGRDINPSMLTKLVVAAGAKRVEVTSPSFTPVPNGYVAQVDERTVTYGGLEHD